MRLSHLEKLAADLRALADGLAADVELAKSNPDPFAALYFAARQNHRRAIDTDGKSGKRIERGLIESYKKATDLGFAGSIREWERLLCICLWPPEPK